MAKIKSTIGSVQELEAAHTEFSKIDVQIKLLEAQMNKELQRVTEKFGMEIKPLTERFNSIVTDMELYCRKNVELLFGGDQKSLEFPFGYIKGKIDSKGSIKLLKEIKDGFKSAAHKMMDLYDLKFIKLEPVLQKDVIAAAVRDNELSDTILASCNLRYVKDVSFTNHVDYKRYEKETGIAVPVQKKGKK